MLYFPKMEPRRAHRPIGVRLNTTAISRIAEHVADGLSSPEGRQEVCGVLLGWLSEEPDGRLTIEDSQAIVSECDPSSARVLLERAAPEFERLAAHHSSGSDAGMPVVGYYRSHIRPEPNLDASDVATLRARLVEPSFCLLVKPSAGQTFSGALFYYRDGAVHAHPGPIRLPNPAWRSSEDAPAQKPAAPPRAEAFDSSVLGLSEPRRSDYQPTVEAGWEPRTLGMRSIGWPLLAAVIVVAAGSYAGYQYLSRNGDWFRALHGINADRPPTAERASLLGLRVVSEGTDLRVSWSRESHLIATAHGALLTIRDGEAKQEVYLDPEQLQSGNVLYRPVNDHVQFRLELQATSAGQNARETVLAISGRNPSAASMSVSPAAPSVMPSPSAPSQTKESAPPSSLLSQQLQAATANRPRRSPEGPPARSRPQLPQTSRRSAAGAMMVDPPLGQLPPANAGAPPRFETTLDASESTAEPRQLAETAAPPAAPRGATTAQTVVPPRPTIQVPPTVPRYIRSMLRDDVVVAVRLEVDANGRVISMEPMRQPGGPMRLILERAAADAALRWQFEPARVGNQKVPAEALVQFRFRRQQEDRRRR